MKRWPRKPLGELCDVRIGRTPRRDQPRFWGGDAVWVTIGELNGGTITSSRENISDAAVRECMPAPIPAGTLLFSFKLSIGKMAVAGCPLYTNEAIAALPIRNPKELSRDFLHFALKAESREGTADAAVLGKVLNKEKVSKLSIPVPPLAEQIRIVNLLDEADELRNLRTQADRRTAALTPALFHEMFGDARANSRGWPTKELRQIGRVVTGSTPPGAKQGMFGGDIPFITPGDLDRNTRETMRYVTKAGAEEARTVRAGSTLVCCIGATIGKTDRSWKRSAFNQQINAIEWGDEIDDDFGVVCMKECSKSVVGQGSQTALPILKKSLFEQIRIPVPPLTLQKEFAARVSEIRAMEGEQVASCRMLDALFQSILHRAFDGQL